MHQGGAFPKLGQDSSVGATIRQRLEVSLLPHLFLSSVGNMAHNHRIVRKVLVRKVPGFKSAGHALLVTTYVAINLAVSFTNLDMSSMTNFASRFAW